MLKFKHLNLEATEAVYGSHKILILENLDKNWEIHVDGKKSSAGPFSTRRMAIEYVNKIVEKLEPEALRLQQSGKPLVSKVKSFTNPSQLTKKKAKRGPFSPNPRGTSRPQGGRQR